MEEDIRDIRELVNKEIRPDRVLVDKDGHAVPWERAFREHGIYISQLSVILVRNDCWSLGVPEGLEDAAFELWKDEWRWFCPQSMVVGIPIERWDELPRLRARSTSLNTFDLQHQNCDDCGADCTGGGGILVLKGECHREAGLSAHYEADDGVLVITCGDCGRLVGKFALSDIRERTMGRLEVQ